MKQRNREQLAMHVSRVSILWNVALSILKLAAGIIAQSGAMISDAIHSASDVFSTVIVMIGVKLSAKAADQEHPYGHERMECVAALLLAVVLFATGVGIGWQGLLKITGPSDRLFVPGQLALWAAVLSVVVKESMYWYTRKAGKLLRSSALMADAWHHRSDALSSVGSFAGILGARLGFPILDSVASLLICLMILKAAVDIFREAISKMTDRSCEPAVSAAICRLVVEQEGVCGIDQIQTRLFGDRIYVDLEIRVPGDWSLWEAHAVAQRVHDRVEEEFSQVKHCMIHVNPQ